MVNANDELGDVSRWRLVGAHLRLVEIETFRDPAALVGNVIIPFVCFLFFVLPNRDVVNSASGATVATLQLTSMLGFSTCLFGYSVSVAQDRESGFGMYLKTLPVGSFPRFLAVAVGALTVTALGVVLLWAASLIATDAELSWDLLAGFGALLLTMVTWSLFGAALGQVVNVKTVITVAQLAFLALAFAGGMLVSPDYLPDGLDMVSRYLPSRASRDLVCGLGSGEGVSAFVVAVHAFWTVLFGVVSVMSAKVFMRR